MKVDYQRHYRHWHNDSPEHVARMVKYLGARFEPHLPADKSAPILDIGCGMGFALETLRECGYTNLEGIDVDAGQIAVARARHLPASLIEDTPTWLRARPGRYQLVLLLDVLEHIRPDLQLDFIAAIHAALKPGGKLLCAVPNASSIIASRQRYIDWTHHTAFTEHSLDFALYHGGFTTITVTEDELGRPRFPWIPRWRWRAWYAREFFRSLRRLQLMAEIGYEEGRRIPLSHNLLAIAIK